MILGRVTGTMHSTVKNAHLEGLRFLVVRPVNLAGEISGKPIVAVDRVDAGVTDLVLVCKEGGSSRIVLGDEQTPIQAMAIAVLDDVALDDVEGASR